MTVVEQAIVIENLIIKYFNEYCNECLIYDVDHTFFRLKEKFPDHFDYLYFDTHDKSKILKNFLANLTPEDAVLAKMRNFFICDTPDDLIRRESVYDVTEVAEYLYELQRKLTYCYSSAEMLQIALHDYNVALFYINDLATKFHNMFDQSKKIHVDRELGNYFLKNGEGTLLFLDRHLPLLSNINEITIRLDSCWVLSILKYTTPDIVSEQMMNIKFCLNECDAEKVVYVIDRLNFLHSVLFDNDCDGIFGFRRK